MEALLAWYGRHARILPWRIGPKERRFGVRPDPYRVWLSEIMLQQTTVKAVIPYFHRFVERWPTVGDLAAADDDDVMAAWAGLGYYARARNLLACARSVAANIGGRFPSSVAELARLSGIGAYTAAAIAAIAHDEPVAVIDGNVERVTARLFAIETPMPAGKVTVRDRLEPLVPRARAGEFAEALMDLGATICTPRKPTCSLCPWCEPCLARRSNRQAEYPMPPPRRTRPIRYGTAFVARRQDGAILLRRRPPHGLLGGMCEVPCSEWTEARPGGAGPPVAARWSPVAGMVEHVFTHFRLRLAVIRGEADLQTAAPEGCWWEPPASLAAQALPNVMKKAIEAAYPLATKPGPAKA
jgi:A/G-specific adenine glycosylase